MYDTFRFALTGADDAPVLLLKGNLDHSADPAVLDLMRSVVRAAPPTAWTIDATRVHFADSTAIRLLVDLSRSLAPDGELRVIATQALARLIDLVCVPGRFTLQGVPGGRASEPFPGESVSVSA